MAWYFVLIIGIACFVFGFLFGARSMARGFFIALSDIPDVPKPIENLRKMIKIQQMATEFAKKYVLEGKHLDSEDDNGKVC